MDHARAVVALAAVAQDTRLAVFRLLVEAGPAGRTAGAIARALGVAPATLSFHLKELLHAGLVGAQPEGRFIRYAADFAQMDRLLAFLTRNCCRGETCAAVPAARLRKARR